MAKRNVASWSYGQFMHVIHFMLSSCSLCRVGSGYFYHMGYCCDYFKNEPDGMPTEMARLLQVDMRFRCEKHPKIDTIGWIWYWPHTSGIFWLIPAGHHSQNDQKAIVRCEPIGYNNIVIHYCEMFLVGHWSLAYLGNCLTFAQTISQPPLCLCSWSISIVA